MRAIFFLQSTSETVSTVAFRIGQSTFITKIGFRILGRLCLNGIRCGMIDLLICKRNVRFNRTVQLDWSVLNGGIGQQPIETHDFGRQTPLERRSSGIEL